MSNEIKGETEKQREFFSLTSLRTLHCSGPLAFGDSPWGPVGGAAVALEVASLPQEASDTVDTQGGGGSR